MGPDRVTFRGAQARPHTPTYKVTVGYHDGFVGIGEISYAGIDALGRAKWAAEIVQQRLKDGGFRYTEVRVDFIGLSSLHGVAVTTPEPYEVRLRLAMRCDDAKSAAAVGFEVRALHVNGPSGGGGGSDPVVKKILAVQSVLIPREHVDPQVHVERIG